MSPRTAVLLLALAATPSWAAATLWHDPTTGPARNLYYGPGGKAHQPHGPFVFVKEDLNGTNPKFDVKDRSGVKWSVKLGSEARSETVVSRIAWAAGYYANEDYYLPSMQIDGLPKHLHRGQKMIGPGGVAYNARLKRDLEDEKKTGTWKWNEDEFTGTREWNGLRVVMALVNNWDLKDANNSVYKTSGSETVYMVSDLGASFGSPNRSFPYTHAKDHLESYAGSHFIRRITPDSVDFQAPARPAWIYIFSPRSYFSRIHLERLGRNVPRDDARWMGRILARLSPAQIHDAFRAAGYSRAEIDAFSRVLMSRITALTDL